MKRLSARIRRRCESPGTGLASPLKLLPQPQSFPRSVTYFTIARTRM
jgi:hypothetical protein